MKQEEVRIGNYVKNLYSGNEVELNPLMLYEFDDYLQPIPLTTEWLLKLGFTRYKFNYYRFSKGPVSIVLKSKEPSFDGKVWINASWLPDLNIEYVHQLQNLYFALTGIELKLTGD